MDFGTKPPFLPETQNCVKTIFEKFVKEFYNTDCPQTPDRRCSQPALIGALGGHAETEDSPNSPKLAGEIPEMKYWKLGIC
jgi:hypothetical protein